VVRLVGVGVGQIYIPGVAKSSTDSKARAPESGVSFETTTQFTVRVRPRASLLGMTYFVTRPGAPQPGLMAIQLT
jgi:hypothetical protein